MLLCVSWAVRRTYPHPSSLAVHYTLLTPSTKHTGRLYQAASSPGRINPPPAGEEEEGKKENGTWYRQPPEACSKLVLLLTIPS